MSNSFKHLTDTAIGFDSQETQDLVFDSPSTSAQDIEKENQNTENNTTQVAVSIRHPIYSDSSLICIFFYFRLQSHHLWHILMKIEPNLNDLTQP